MFPWSRCFLQKRFRFHSVLWLQSDLLGVRCGSIPKVSDLWHTRWNKKIWFCCEAEERRGSLLSWNWWKKQHIVEEFSFSVSFNCVCFVKMKTRTGLDSLSWNNWPAWAQVNQALNLSLYFTFSFCLPSAFWIIALWQIWPWPFSCFGHLFVYGQDNPS